MRFTADKKAIEKALKDAGKWADSNNEAAPILSSMLFSVGNHVKITTTDSQAVYQDTIEATPEAGGEIAVNCKMLLNLLKNANGNLIFQSTDNQLKITETDGTVYALAGIAGDEFPSVRDTMEAEIGGRYNQINSKNLKECLEKVLPAACKEKNSYRRMYNIMKCIFFQQNEDKLRMVATDGLRLHISNTECQGEVEDMLIPSRYLRLLYKILPKSPVDIIFVRRNQDILFEIGTKRILIRLEREDYLDYWKVVPNCDRKITVNKKEMVDAIKKVMPFVNKGTKAIIFDTKPGNMKLTSGSDVEDNGMVEKNIHCECKDKFRVGVNGSYMLDILNNINDEEVTIQHADALSSIRIDSEDSIFVVMPIRIT